MTAEEEAYLIKQTIAGNHQAFQKLVIRYQNYAFTTAYYVLKNREDAEEAAQDAFLKAYKRLAHFEGQSKFSTWLYTIVYRTAIDKKRLKKSHYQSIDDSANNLQITDGRRSTANYEADKSDLKSHLERVIQQLKPIDSTIIGLYYLGEQSVKEIADITGLSQTNIKTKLFRIRETLKEKLEKKFNQEIYDWV